MMLTARKGYAKPLPKRGEGSEADLAAKAAKAAEMVETVEQ